MQPVRETLIVPFIPSTHQSHFVGCSLQYTVYSVRCTAHTGIMNCAVSSTVCSSGPYTLLSLDNLPQIDLSWWYILGNIQKIVCSFSICLYLCISIHIYIYFFFLQFTSLCNNVLCCRTFFCISSRKQKVVMMIIKFVCLLEAYLHRVLPLKHRKSSS